MKHLEKGFSKNNNLLIYIVVILITFIAQFIIGAIAVITVYYFATGSVKGALIDAQGMLMLMDKNIVLCVLMIPLTISLFFLLLLIKQIHKRSFAEVVNGTTSIRWNRIGFGFGFWFVMIAVDTVVSFIISPDNFTLQFNIAQFIPLFIISIVLIPLQTTFEEVMTRGYLAQGIGTFTKSRWMALLLPALIFTLLHIANPEIKEYGLGIMLANYLTMALLWGLISILDDGIELGMGMHAANNIFISLFTSQPGTALETDAVFRIVKPDPYIGFLTLIVISGITLLIFYRKYNWSFNTLNKKVEKPNESASSVS